MTVEQFIADLGDRPKDQLLQENGYFVSTGIVIPIGAVRRSGA